jgi:DNA polymerase I
MVRMEGVIEDAKLSARMLLQVHDELIFEVPKEETDKTIKIVTKAMENAAFPAIQMKVPLKVDARAAHNWDEAH